MRIDYITQKVLLEKEIAWVRCATKLDKIIYFLKQINIGSQTDVPGGPKKTVPRKTALDQ